MLNTSLSISVEGSLKVGFFLPTSICSRCFASYMSSGSTVSDSLDARFFARLAGMPLPT